MTSANNYLNADYGIWSWLLTKDHKRIAILYLISITFMFVLGGLIVWGAHILLIYPFNAIACTRGFAGVSAPAILVLTALALAALAASPARRHETAARCGLDPAIRTKGCSACSRSASRCSRGSRWSGRGSRS